MTGHDNMQFIKLTYKKLLPSETRYWLYKLRHKSEVEALKSAVHPSPKGTFSLRQFTHKKSIFVHITKSAGTSVASSLFGELPYHYTARQYRVIFGRKDFNNYFKFCFVRNPWDRLYSAYSFLKAGGWHERDAAWAEKNLTEFKDFNDFVINWLNHDRLYSHMHFWPQSDFICNDWGKPIIDYLGYFESIDSDYKYISGQLNVTEQLQHKNSSKRLGYKDIYNEESINKVRHLYDSDIKNFGYRFDNFSRKKILNREFVESD